MSRQYKKILSTILINLTSLSTVPLFSRSHVQPQVDLSLPATLSSSSTIPGNLTVALGTTARLHCTVTNVEQEAVSMTLLNIVPNLSNLLQISWIRLSDYRILTNGLITFTADDRFTVLHKPGGNEWTLQISGVQARDQGEYQCQAATTTGIRTISSWLRVTQPRASILGSREKHVNLGDSVTISCELRNSVGTPEFVFWYHNSTMVNFLPGVSVSTHLLGPDPDALWVAPPNTTVSTLLIFSTKPEHAGNYTCAPPHSSSDSVRLYVSSGNILDNVILQSIMYISDLGLPLQQVEQIHTMSGGARRSFMMDTTRISFFNTCFIIFTILRTRVEPSC